MGLRHNVGDTKELGMDINKALEELRKDKERKFDQSVDLIVNLKGVDIKRDNIAFVVSVPHNIKEKKVCGFFVERNNMVDSVTEPEFAKYKDKKALKNLVKKYDFFIANAKLMPKVATVFGKVLGPAGKMPSPQLGILTQESDGAINDLLEKISNSIKFRAKEPSIKVSIAKTGMDDKKIIENFDAVYSAIVNSLPTKKENVRSVLVKLSMSKPIKLEVK